VRKEPEKRKRQDGAAWPAPWAEASPLRPAKRPRQSIYEPGTPALSPLGAPFTPVRKSEQENLRICPAEPQPVQHVSSSEDFWRVQLECIYRHRNPYKLGKVPALLAKYKGQEAVLYKKLCLTYDLDPNKFYSSPTAWGEEEEEDDGPQVYGADGSQEHRTGNVWTAAFASGPFSVALGASESLLPNFSRPSLGETLMEAFRRLSGGNSQDDAAAVEPRKDSPPLEVAKRRHFAFSAQQPPEQRPVALALGTNCSRTEPTPEPRISPFAANSVSSRSWVPVFPQSGEENSSRALAASPGRLPPTTKLEEQQPSPRSDVPGSAPRQESSFRYPASTQTAEEVCPAVRQLSGQAVQCRREPVQASKSSTGETPHCPLPRPPAQPPQSVPMVNGRPLPGAKRVLPAEITASQPVFALKRRRLEDGEASEVGMPDRHSAPPPKAMRPQAALPLTHPGQRQVGRLTAERRVWPPPRPPDE